MNLLQTIKAIFGRPSQQQTVLTEAVRTDDAQTTPHNIEAYIAKHMAEIYIDAEALMKKYGSDFYNFLYRTNVETFIQQEVIPFKYLNNKHNDFLDYDHWIDKHPFNFPGPFYTGESDTCGTGDSEAPDNVLYDSYCCEYIFKQPQTFAEFLCVLDAAAVEVFDSYSCNGNSYWTYMKCKEWWNNRAQLLDELEQPEIKKVNGDRIQLYTDYLNGSAETDLRRYCYFLENGIYPTNDSVELPPL